MLKLGKLSGAMLQVVAMATATATAAVVVASEARLQPGRYRVEVRLELPHLSAADAKSNDRTFS